MFHFILWCVRFIYFFSPLLALPFVHSFVLFFALLYCLFVARFFRKCAWLFEILLIHMHSNFNPTPKVKSINQSFVIPFFHSPAHFALLLRLHTLFFFFLRNPLRTTATEKWHVTVRLLILLLLVLLWLHTCANVCVCLWRCFWVNRNF